MWACLTRGRGQGPVVLGEVDEDRNQLLALHCLHCQCAQLTVRVWGRVWVLCGGTCVGVVWGDVCVLCGGRSRERASSIHS